MTNPIQEAVKDYLGRGWTAVRVKERGKVAIGQWQSAEPQAENFASTGNVGVILGHKSGGLVDIDLDNQMAQSVAAMQDLFGDYPSFGREGLSYPGHYILQCPDLGDNEKRHAFSPKGDYIDIRAGKGYTVFPPSEHEAKIRWSAGKAPGRVPTMRWSDLSARAWLVAFLATALKFYPGDGEHDNYILHVAGTLAHRKVSPEIGARLVHGLCTLAGDTHEINTRTAKALTAWNKVQNKEPVTGLTRLGEDYFEEAFTKKLRKYLIPKEEHDRIGPKAIYVDEPNVSVFTDQVAARILEANPHIIFKRDGNLVRVRTVDTLHKERDGGVIIHPGTIQLVPVKEPWLDYSVSKLGIQFYGYSGKVRKLRPPSGLDKRIINIPDPLPFKRIAGLSTTPILGASAPGFDEESGIYLAFPKGVFPDGPKHPSQDDARAALARLKYPFREFPFEGAGSKSVVLSAMISGVIRSEMKTCPLHAFNAPVAGTGKTKLAEMVSVIITGQPATNVIEFTSGKDEMQKRFFSLFLRAAGCITIDNVDAPLGGTFLNIILTTEVVTSRVLGFSEMPSVSTQALIMATGNNLLATDDTVRRVVTATINAKVERPDTRDFKFDPVAEIEEHRPQLVVDCLTILRAYRAARRPCDPTVLGKFEDWTLVRGALIWLGEDDPILTQQQAYQDDSAREARQALLQSLRDEFGANPFKVSDIKALGEYTEIHNIFDAALEAGWTNIGAGRLLSSNKDHPTGKLTLKKLKASGNHAFSYRINDSDQEATQLPLAKPERDPYRHAIPEGGEGQR